MTRSPRAGDVPGSIVLFSAADQPRGRLALRVVLTLLMLVAAVVAVGWLGHWRYSSHGGALVVIAVPGVLDIICLLRARVTLRPDGIEVRRVRTRLYPWASLSSVELTDAGTVEITPNGWVRHLPIPARQSQVALELIKEWRSRFAQPIPEIR